MSTYLEVLKQREKIDKEIANAKAAEYDAVVAEIKQKMIDYGITAADLGLGKKALKGAKVRTKVDPKYKDPDSDLTWSGRGKAPKWIAGKNRDEFLVQK